MSDINLVNHNSVLNRIQLFFKRETVLIIALASAMLSMFFVHPSIAYASYIDYKVLSCLFCLMAVVSGLRMTGLFDRAASALTSFAGTIHSMAFILIFATFFISMAITNDVALITLVPFSLLLMKDIQNTRTRITIITLQTIAANIGSSLTPVGNPQNLYLFSFYQMNALEFFSSIAPVVCAGGLLLVGAVFTIKNEKLQGSLNGANYTTDFRLIIIYGILFILSVLAVFQVVDYRIVTICVLIALVIVDRKVFTRIDYSLLFTFLGFFIFIGNLQHIDAINTILTSIVGKNVLLVSALTSQIISNVPAAILLSHFTTDSASLLRGVSIGGMGTIIASLASVISFKFFIHEYPGKTKIFLRVFTFWNSIFFILLYSFCFFLK